MWIVLSHGRTTGPIGVFWGERGRSNSQSLAEAKIGIVDCGCCSVVGIIKTGLFLIEGRAKNITKGFSLRVYQKTVTYCGSKLDSDAHRVLPRAPKGILMLLPTGSSSNKEFDWPVLRWQKYLMGRPLFRYFLRGPPQLDMWHKPGFVKHPWRVWLCKPGSSEFREGDDSRPLRGIRLSHATRPLVTRLCLHLAFSQNISVKTNHLVQHQRLPFRPLSPISHGSGGGGRPRTSSPESWHLLNNDAVLFRPVKISWWILPLWKEAFILSTWCDVSPSTNGAAKEVHSRNKLGVLGFLIKLIPCVRAGDMWRWNRHGGSNLRTPCCFKTQLQFFIPTHITACSV